MATVINNSDWQSSGQIIEAIIKEAGRKHVCPKCGKEDVPCEVTRNGVKRIVYASNCDCYEKEQKAKEEQKRKEWLQQKFKKANIGKRYADITLDKLEAMGTENVAAAKKYVENFNPESGASIHMIGEFGNGKTSEGYAIIKALLPKFNCVSITWNEIVTRCYYAKAFDSSETIDQILKWLAQFDLIMIDEFVINIKDDKEINLATALFDNLYKDNKCFILINNPCDIVDMKKVPRLGKLLDRVKDQAEIFTFKHESYRGVKNA